MARTGLPSNVRSTIRNSDGLTLLEILVAVVLFTVAMLIGGRSVVGFVHQVAVSEVSAQASQFAMEELERLRLLPYDEITSTAAAPVPEAPEYTRAVDVAVVGSNPSERYAYRMITVTVQPPADAEPVTVSSAVAE